MYVGTDIESLMAWNVTDPEKHNFFLFCFQINTKSNRSSIKSQGIWLHCLCLPSSLIQLQFTMRKYNLHFSQAYCISNHSHIHVWVYVEQNSNNGLKCHLIIYSNVCFYNEQKTLLYYSAFSYLLKINSSLIIINIFYSPHLQRILNLNCFVIQMYVSSITTCSSSRHHWKSTF